MSARKNFWRSSCRAAAVSASGSGGNCRFTAAENSSATWRAVLWMAGAMMWDGVSLASWMIHSPRSVSTTVIPAPSSAGFR